MTSAALASGPPTATALPMSPAARIASDAPRLQTEDVYCRYGRWYRRYGYRHYRYYGYGYGYRPYYYAPSLSLRLF